jgi:5-hydroxyisourate hydrolase-like protein (transthyretin family)
LKKIIIAGFAILTVIVFCFFLLRNKEENKETAGKNRHNLRTVCSGKPEFRKVSNEIKHDTSGSIRKNPFDIIGSVNNALTGEPIQNVEISIILHGVETRNIVLMSNQSGRYSVRINEGFPVLINAVHEGYLPLQKFMKSSEGPEIEVNFLLIPFSSVGGTVMDKSGNFLEGAAVTLFLPFEAIETSMQFIGDDDEKADPSKYSVVTDAKGEFFFIKVPPADGYSICAISDGYMPASKEGLSILPGKSTTVNLTLEQGGSLSGNILLDAPEDAAYVRVTAYHSNWVNSNKLNIGGNADISLMGGQKVLVTSPCADAIPDQNGRFELSSLPEGEVRIEMKLQKPGLTKRSIIRTDINKGNNGDLGDIAFQENGNIHGVVTNEGGNPLADIEIRINKENEGSLPAAYTDNGGRYSARGYGKGVFRISPATLGTGYKSTKQIVSGLNIECNLVLEKLEKENIKKRTIIELIIKNGGKLGEEMFIAVLDKEGKQIRPSVKIASDLCSFSVEKQGHYYLEISWKNCYHKTELLEVIPGTAATVTVDMEQLPENGHVIMGQVYDKETGKPASGVDVYVGREDHELAELLPGLPKEYFRFVSTTSNKKGSFILSGLSPGREETVVLIKTGFKRHVVSLPTESKNNSSAVEIFLER